MTVVNSTGAITEMWTTRENITNSLAPSNNKVEDSFPRPKLLQNKRFRRTNDKKTKAKQGRR